MNKICGNRNCLYQFNTGNYCIQCGSTLTDTTYCNQCNTVRDKEEQYCGNCGKLIAGRRVNLND